MASQVQQFITRVNRLIKDSGLLQMSGTRFDRGDTPMTFLKQVAACNVTENGITQCSVGQAAVEANAMLDSIDVEEGRVLFRKRANSGMVPKNAGLSRPYTDEVF